MGSEITVDLLNLPWNPTLSRSSPAGTHGDTRGDTHFPLKPTKSLNHVLSLNTVCAGEKIASLQTANKETGPEQMSVTK